MKVTALALFVLLADMPLAASILTVTSNGDTGSPGELRTTIASANSGDTIVFGVSGQIVLNSPLNIAASLSIIGNGIAINANGAGAFQVFGSVNDVFANLSLLNGSIGIAGSPSGTVSVLDSTLSGFTEAFSNVTGTVTNSTFSGNTNAIFGGNVGLYDSTISGGTVGTSNTSLTIGNTIVYGNTVDIGPGTTVTDLGNNLIGTGGGFTNGTNGDQVGIDPRLGPLANNGGPTLTYALLPGSPAIDAGNNAIIPSGVTTDQRGFPRISGANVDIGAFETPEPGTWITCLLGAAIAGIRLRKR